MVSEHSMQVSLTPILPYPIQCPVESSGSTPSSFAVPGFFKAIDKDGSGSLDPAEVQRGFRRLGVDVQLGDPEVWGMLNHVVELMLNQRN